MKSVTIHTDGGCEGNPGPGGWAAVLTYQGRSKEISGGAPATTNNRMELLAAISALQALKEPCQVQFFTDSQYVRQGITAWINRWKAKGWLTTEKKPVSNEDLWRALDAETRRHRIEWHWLKGHAGHAGNERCDQLAAAEIAKIKKQYPPQQLRELLATFQAERDAKSRRASTPPLFQ